MSDLPAGQRSGDYLERALRASEASNLDPKLDQPLLSLAKAVLLADLTGVGRERFPGYLPGPPPVLVYRDVRTQAGVARRIDDATVEAHLLWAGRKPDGEYVERRTAIIRLRYGDRSWAPIKH